MIINQLLASNDALRSQLGHFKTALQKSLATAPAQNGSPRQGGEDLRNNSPYRVGGSPGARSPKYVKMNHAMVLSVPALDKQLALVHRRTQMYVESNEKLQERIKKLTDGKYIKKLEEQVTKLQEQVLAITEENKVMRSQQRDADKAAVKEYKDRQNFPEKLNAAKSDLRVQKNRLKKQTEQITDLQRKERAQSTKLKALREENTKLAHGLEEAGIDVKKLLAMKLEQVVAPDLPLRGEQHTAEVEEQQTALREERDKLAEDVRALGRMMTGYRSKGAREIKSMQAQVQKYRAEKETLQVTLDQRDRELRAHLLKVKSLKRTLRDLAYGELKLREASGVMPPDDIVSPAQLTGMDPAAMDKTIPTVTTPLKTGNHEGAGGNGLEKTTIVDKSRLDVSGLDSNDSNGTSGHGKASDNFAFQPSPPPGSAGSRQLTKPSTGRRVVGGVDDEQRKEEQRMEVAAFEAKLMETENERVKKTKERSEELRRDTERRTFEDQEADMEAEVEAAERRALERADELMREEEGKAATLLQAKQRQKQAAVVVGAKRDERRQDDAATMLQSKQRQKAAKATVEAKRAAATAAAKEDGTDAAEGIAGDKAVAIGDVGAEETKVALTAEAELDEPAT